MMNAARHQPRNAGAAFHGPTTCRARATSAFGVTAGTVGATGTGLGSPAVGSGSWTAGLGSLTAGLGSLASGLGSLAARLSGSVAAGLFGAVLVGLIGAAAVGLFGATPALAQVQEHGPAKVTFNRDVMPILQANCQECHQDGSIAPMPLLTYRDAYRWSAGIREKVAGRVMPPWHLDPTVGIQEFRNDRSLSKDEIATVLAWIDGGRVEGDPTDLPPPVEFPDPNEWRLADDFGEPDLVVASEPYTLEAVTQDKWFRPVTPTGLTEPRWVKAIEIKPAGNEARTITHHVLAFLQQDEEQSPMSAGIVEASTRGGAMGGPGLFMEWAVGKEGEIFPEGAGKIMLPGSQIRWEVHMHAMGKRVEDSYVELGIWFYPKGQEPRNRTRLMFYNATGPTGLDIPPGEVSVTQDFHTMRWPARLENFQPHMHMRGKAMSLEAIYPDGRKELINQVDNFQWNWHVNYIYADGAAPLLPAGTTLVITAWHDNTTENPNNPDPEQWVDWGDRTVDEMAHLWVDVTYLDPEEFDALVAARADSQAQATQTNDTSPQQTPR